MDMNGHVHIYCIGVQSSDSWLLMLLAFQGFSIGRVRESSCGWCLNGFETIPNLSSWFLAHGGMRKRLAESLRTLPAAHFFA